ncbi:MAG: tetratricopeptide repeat protein [Hyphomicrobium sp.]|jgi:tetratricopeptide (TPR) repeat protein
MTHWCFVRALVVAAGVLGGGGTAWAVPTDMPAKAGDGASALVRGDLQQALSSYSEALSDTALSNDRRAAILNDRGVVYIKLGQARQAIEDFNAAAQFFPEYAPVYNNRGNLLLSLGLLKEAVKDFDRAIVLAPGYAAAYNNRAGALVRLGKVEDAIADYTKAIKLLPSNPAPLSGRGRAHLALSRPHAAIRDFSRAVQADARFAPGYRNRAEAKLEVQHYDEAIEDLSRAIAFDVTQASSYVLRGQAYLTTRNTAAAIKDFSQAIDLDPKNAPAYAARGFAYGLAEAYDEAYGDLNKAIELDPRWGTAFAYRAFVYKQNAQIDVALRDIEVAMKLSSDRAEVHWAKAEIEEAQGRPEIAVADLKKALSLRPGYKEAEESLQRLGAGAVLTEETEVTGAGIDVWRVVLRGGRYFAVSDTFPRLSIPLEMMGAGEPQLLEWELKEQPYKGIGVLRFLSGTVAAGSGREDIELAAVVDLDANLVIAIEPHRQGDKTANWTWADGKVTVASADGVTDEFSLRSVAQNVAAPYRGYNGEGGGAWAPWSDPWAGQTGAGQQPVKRAQVRRKPKTIFDLFFN